MSYEVIEQFNEQIKENLKLFDIETKDEELLIKLKDIYKKFPFNEISNDKLILFLYEGNYLYKLFYKYSELEKIKEKLKNKTGEENIIKYKKIKLFFNLIKSERNGNFIVKNIKFERSYNIYNKFLLFQYFFGQKFEEKTTLREYMKKNLNKINERFVVLICREIVELLQECHDKEIVLLNLSLDTLFFKNKNYSNIFFNDFSKSKTLDKKSYEYNNKYYLKREFYKIDIYDLGKIMFLLLSKHENEDDTNLTEKIPQIRNISQNMETLLEKMLESEVIFRFNLYQIIEFLNINFKNIEKENNMTIKINNSEKELTLTNFTNKKRKRKKYKIKI